MLTSSSQQEPYWWHYTQRNCYSITYPWTEQQRAKRLMTKIYAALYFFTRGGAWIIQGRVFSIWTVTTFKKAICPLRLKQCNLFWRQLWAHFRRKCWPPGNSPPGWASCCSSRWQTAPHCFKWGSESKRETHLYHAPPLPSMYGWWGRIWGG